MRLVADLIESPILFFNLMLWTQSFFDYDENGEKRPISGDLRSAPFITWPAQDREILRLHRAVQRADSIWWNKTREVGGTWLLMGYIDYCFVLKRDFHSLVVSRKEEEVYAKGDPDTLFEKIAYNLHHDRMPKWLLPGYEAKERNFVNDNTGSTIAGESTNSDVGRSGRRDLAVVDEAAAVDNLESIDRSLGDTAGCRVYVSTPKPGSYFNRLVSSRAFLKAEIGWEEDPRRGKGRRFVEKGSDDWVRLRAAYGDHHCFKNAAGFWCSPWYELQLMTRSPRDMAENVDRDLAGAGTQVFPPMVVHRKREMHSKPPLLEGDLLFAKAINEGVAYEATSEPERLNEADDRLRAREWRSIRFFGGRGPLKLWCELFEDEAGFVRPPQDRFYIVAADPGDGRQGANGAVMVGNDQGEQVAEWVSADYSARDQARVMVALALWFGGFRRPLIWWETNGVGGAVTEMLRRHLDYPSLYHKRTEGRDLAKVTGLLGWASTRHSKRAACEDLADEMAADRIIIRSRACYDEMNGVILDDRGSVVQEKVADLTTGAQEAHGDRVIPMLGFAMCLREGARLLGEELERARAEGDLTTPYGRWKSRLRQARREERRAKSPGWRW